ncbi:sulfotransferase family protein [Aestuariibius insulae]|uniref:sulfotransferase family protein n=1 Tax=Aestuariibius insulae TaxID=2058287 RepID=UPI00345EFDF5
MTGFNGTWMTTSESMVYRPVPKCACSTIGQIMFYSDNHDFFDGDIHDAEGGMHKWSFEGSQAAIADNVSAHRSYVFSFVRNPYTRILSAFFDKVCGIQRNGGRYRGDLLPKMRQKYGFEFGPDPETGEFDQIQSFRRFLLFARDTIRFHRPIKPDIHWSPIWTHLVGLVENGGTYDGIFWTEKFNDGMQQVLDAVETPNPIDLSEIPRFNESEGHGPKRAHPVEDYFDDLSMHLVFEIYKRDFELFGYDREDPSNKMPVREIDLDQVHKVLAG